MTTKQQTERERGNRPYPWKCPVCRKYDVYTATVPYTAEIKHDGLMHTIHIRPGNPAVPVVRRVAVQRRRGRADQRGTPIPLETAHAIPDPAAEKGTRPESGRTGGENWGSGRNDLAVGDRCPDPVAHERQPAAGLLRATCCAYSPCGERSEPRAGAERRPSRWVSPCRTITTNIRYEKRHPEDE